MARREAEALLEWLRRWGVCGCGRDYLTVALEDAHWCPRPRVPPWDSPAWDVAPAGAERLRPGAQLRLAIA